jgi:hypothetical protein
VLGSKRWSFVHECGGGKHGIASAIGGHDDVHDELYSLVVQSVGCGPGHDGSLGFIVQKPSLTQELPLVNINITGHMFFVGEIFLLSTINTVLLPKSLLI